MSKLLKAVEKAKRNKLIQEEHDREEKTHREKSQDEASLSGSDHTTESGADDAAVDSPKEDELKDGGDFCVVPKTFYKDELVLDELLLEKNRILNKRSSSSFTDIYNLLRTQILHRTKRKGIMSLWLRVPCPAKERQ